MLRYIIKRVVNAIIILFIIISSTWFLLKFLPGSPFNDKKLPPEVQHQLAEHYGLNDPLLEQYGRYLWNVLHGDLGTSFQLGGREVTDILANRLPVSALIGFQGILIGIAFGLVLGAVAAMRRGSVTDRTSTLISVLGISVPIFVLAPVLQYFVAFKWGLLPISFFDSWVHSILPSIVLGILVMATIAAYTRTEMLEVLGQDYVTLAKSKGLSQATVVTKHVVRNSMIPLITVIVPLAAALLTGTLIVEKVFGLPGIGQQFVSAAFTNDYPMILGTTILFSVFFVTAYLLQDLLYGLVDPRIRQTSGGK